MISAIYIPTQTCNKYGTFAVNSRFGVNGRFCRPVCLYVGRCNVVCQAIDDDCNQTGQMTAALLDWPQVEHRAPPVGQLN